MSFKRPPADKASLILSSVFILSLTWQNQLGLYIHPRYNLFTIALSVLCLVVATAYQKHHNEHKHAFSAASLPLIFILACAFILPARSLTSATVSQRQIDSQSIGLNSSLTNNPLLAGSSKGLKLGDWYRLIQTNQSPAYYADKPAKINGFVFDAGLGPDTFYLARFIVTCCAVDAQPIGVPVRVTNWATIYQQDTWLEIEGEFELLGTTNGEELVLQPNSVTEIEEPSNPYAN